MTPGEKSILDALNLLTLVHRTQKQNFSIIGQKGADILKINIDQLSRAGLSSPTFINALEMLTKKRYLFSLSIPDNSFYNALQKFFEPKIQKSISNIALRKDFPIPNQKIKDDFMLVYQNLLPKNLKSDTNQDFSNASFADIFQQLQPMLKDISKDLVSIVVLTPFRSIHRLLKKMNQGILFNDIQDTEIWYDSMRCELHFGKSVIKTQYRNIPNKAHFLLDHLFNKTEDSVVGYSDLIEFNQDDFVKENKSYADSIRNLVRKNKKLRTLFHIHSDRIEIAKKYKNDIH